MAIARRPVSSVLAFVSAACVVASAAMAQSSRPYRDGVKAVEKGEWQEASRLLAAAIAERAEERKRYTPYFYLGVARYELGDCDGALQAWAESERQGAIGREEVDRMTKGRAACQAWREESARAAAERAAAGAIGDARRAADALRAAVSADLAEAWRRGSPSPATRQSQAETRLGAAQRQVEQAKAKRDATALAEAERTARAVAAELAELLADVDRVRAERTARVGELRAALDDTLADAREALRATSALESSGSEMKRRRADLEGLIAESRKIAAGSDPAYLEGLTARLRNSVEQLTQVSAGPPRSLATAVDTFFAGDYARVVDLLGNVPDDARARAHALLLRSAARYHLWVEQGESDPALLDEAAADAVACRRVNAGLRPPATLFSPRFLEFFTSAGAPSADD